MNVSLVGALVVLVALLGSACGPQEQATDPVSVVQDYFEKINTGDLDGAMAYVPEDATYIAWNVLPGKERIAEHYQGEIERNVLFELSGIEVDGSEVTFTLKATSDVVTFEDVVWRAVVEDGILVSLRYTGQ